jgi:hypothetical protein
LALSSFSSSLTFAFSSLFSFTLAHSFYSFLISDDLVATSSKSTEEAVAALTAATSTSGAPAPSVKFEKSALDADTLDLMSLIFDEDVARQAMKAMNIDPVLLARPHHPTRCHPCMRTLNSPHL